MAVAVKLGGGWRLERVDDVGGDVDCDDGDLLRRTAVGTVRGLGNIELVPGTVKRIHVFAAREALRA